MRTLNRSATTHSLWARVRSCASFAPRRNCWPRPTFRCLILGENGSGKDTAARLIHKLSVRSGFKFLKVNCAALPGDLLETELFGYERSDSAGSMTIQTRQTRIV